MPIASPWDWWPWLVAAIVVLALIWILARWLSRKPAPAPAIVVPPHVRARNRLRQALDLIAQPKLFCILISDTLRLYLEERFHWHAPERTTEEFLGELGASPNLTPVQKRSLAEFLNRCDLVKFARQSPAEPELRELLDVALQLVEQTAPKPETQQPGAPTTPAPSEGSTPQPALP